MSRLHRSLHRSFPSETGTVQSKIIQYGLILKFNLILKLILLGSYLSILRITCEYVASLYISA